MFYINYEECKYLGSITGVASNTCFILTMRNVNSCVWIVPVQNPAVLY